MTKIANLLLRKSFLLVGAACAAALCAVLAPINTAWAESEESTADLISVSGVVEWIDFDDKYSNRPDSVTLNLYANGELEGTMEVDGSIDNWHYAFESLPARDDSNNSIDYTVEQEAINGYDTSIGWSYDPVSGTLLSDDYTILNELMLTGIGGEIIWSDGNSEYGQRAESIIVSIFDANGEVLATTEISKENESDESSDAWEYDLDNLPCFINGIEVDYDAFPITASSVEGYQNVSDEDFPAIIYLVADDLENILISVEGDIAWKDSNNKAGKRPEAVTVNLYGDFELFGNMDVDATVDNWHYAFESLPQYDKYGREMFYYVEADSINGYEITVEDFNITCEYTGAETEGKNEDESESGAEGIDEAEDIIAQTGDDASTRIFGLMALTSAFILALASLTARKRA